MSGVNLVVDGSLSAISSNVFAVENAATTLTYTNSGSTVFVPQSTHPAVNGGANSILLPAPKAGFKVRIQFQSVGDNTAGHNWQIQSTAANMLGNTVAVAAGLAATNVAAACTYLRRSGTAANALEGDYVDIASDGTNYWFFAFSSGAATPWATA